jgi:outer membrane protein
VKNAMRRLGRWAGGAALTASLAWSPILFSSPLKAQEVAPQAGIVRLTPSDEEFIRAAVARALSATPQSGVVRPPQGGASSSSSGSSSGTMAPGPAGPPLTLDQVLRMIEANHPKLRGSDVERGIATAKRVEKQGAFDPVISLTSDFIRFNSTSSRGRLSETFQNEMSVDFLTRSGIKVFGAARSNIGNVKSPLSSTGDFGEYVFGIKVPLFRGFRVNEKAAGERQARLGESQSDINFAQTRLELFRKAAGDYWDWVAAKRKLDVARNILEIAKTRANAIRDRAEAGDLPPIDMTEANQEVVRREGNLTKAERDFQKSQFKLSLSLWDDAGRPAPLPEEMNVPDVAAQLPPEELPDSEVVVGRTFALQRRPELQTIQVSRDAAKIDLDLAKNQRRPVVDFALSPGRDFGVAGVGNTMKAGLIFELPLRQRTADGRISAAQLKMQKIDLDEQNERLRVLNDVNDAVSAVNTAWRRYLAARQELDFAIVLERGENQRFMLGDSTLFLVNQRERATAEARNKVIETQAEYELARATFRVATVQF